MEQNAQSFPVMQQQIPPNEQQLQDQDFPVPKKSKMWIFLLIFLILAGATTYYFFFM